MCATLLSICFSFALLAKSPMYCVLCLMLLRLSGVSCRLFGTSLAEMPYVATRKDARRAGNCRRLLKVRTLEKQPCLQQQQMCFAEGNDRHAFGMYVCLFAFARHLCCRVTG